MDYAQAQAHAEVIFGPDPILKDRGDGIRRYFVAPRGWLPHSGPATVAPWHQGCGPTWEAAFGNYNRHIVQDGLVPIARALSRYRFTSHDEHRLYPLMEQVLRDAGIDFEREHRLDEKSRLDFWFPKLRVALEVKVRGQHHAVLRQLRRYAAHPEIGGILLASSVAKLASVPEILESKPSRAVRLAGPFG